MSAAEDTIRSPGHGEQRDARREWAELRTRIGKTGEPSAGNRMWTEICRRMASRTQSSGTPEETALEIAEQLLGWARQPYPSDCATAAARQIAKTATAWDIQRRCLDTDIREISEALATNPHLGDDIRFEIADRGLPGWKPSRSDKQTTTRSSAECGNGRKPTPKGRSPARSCATQAAHPTSPKKSGTTKLKSAAQCGCWLALQLR